jgi:hypothetical protein
MHIHNVDDLTLVMVEINICAEEPCLPAIKG